VGPLYSREERESSILREALARYLSDDVPQWSTLYGTHVPQERRLETPEDAARRSEWVSLAGECWRIPHDNRVNLCFLAPLTDIITPVRVRNFLIHFHRPQEPGIPKGEFFNVWDWFDTGISAYWYPGKRASDVARERVELSLAKNISDRNDPVHLSSLVAPWRRIMYVEMSHYPGPYLTRHKATSKA
jgi:hypothetical protein